jgi:predicted dehydrogenase
VGVCAELLGTPPVHTTACAIDSGELLSILLDGAEGRAAQINLWAGPAVSPQCRIEVVAQQGTATAHLPHRLHWRDSDGQHAERRPSPPAEDVLLERFAKAFQTGQPLRPGFEDAYQALTWLRAAWQSRAPDQTVSSA